MRSDGSNQKTAKTSQVVSSNLERRSEEGWIFGLGKSRRVSCLSGRSSYTGDIENREDEKASWKKASPQAEATQEEREMTV